MLQDRTPEPVYSLLVWTIASCYMLKDVVDGLQPQTDSQVSRCNLSGSTIEWQPTL